MKMPKIPERRADFRVRRAVVGPTRLRSEAGWMHAASTSTVGAGHFIAWILVSAMIVAPIRSQAQEQTMSEGYEALIELNRAWRAFERPPQRDGAPDYTAATFERRHSELATLRARLRAIDSSSWPVARQVDYRLVLAEMNGLDFYIRVLKPWARDPAFYKSLYTEQSDTPAHEGPTHHAAIELWTYAFPLDAQAETRLAAELRGIPPLLAQARSNLTGDARDLWTTGAGTMRKQVSDLEDLRGRVRDNATELTRVTQAAIEATREFADWLDKQAPSKNGPSGIGRENYTWSLRNVHLVPMSWEEEVSLLERELARAHASLRLEEHRNRALPQLPVAANAEEYRRRAEEGVTRYMSFLERNDILPMRDYLEPALRAHLGTFQPEATRDFFDMATHREPMTLYTHFYHWFDLARMREEPHPSPIRREALLYNIWDSRAEGMATAMEEMMLHAGLYDDNPRAREIVWIMLAQRAARGLASLRAQANEFTLKEARNFQVMWTPRGWMRPDLDLLGFEQQLYLRQPGYGTSYVTGKYLLERLLADRARELGSAFTLRRWFDEVNAAGVIPVELIRWELTGIDDDLPAAD
jgi:uncharacterized protein (DUF885 family)